MNFFQNKRLFSLNRISIYIFILLFNIFQIILYSHYKDDYHGGYDNDKNLSFYEFVNSGQKIRFLMVCKFDFRWLSKSKNDFG